MAQEWFYTKDGKSKRGPVTSADLQALARSGTLLPSDMILKVGTTQWMAASSIDGLFTNSQLTGQELSPAPSKSKPMRPKFELDDRAFPVPEEADSSPNVYKAVREGSATMVTTVGRLCLGLGVFLSLLAAVFALFRIGGDVLSPIIASLAIPLSMVAAAAALLTPGRRAALGSAATAIFLGLATLLFSVGSSLAARTIKEYRDIAAKANDVEQDRNKAESARREAKLLKADAEKARDEAMEEPKETLKRAEGISKENDARVEQIKQEQAALKKTREDVESEIKIKRDSLEVMLALEQAKFSVIGEEKF